MESNKLYNDLIEKQKCCISSQELSIKCKLLPSSIEKLYKQIMGIFKKYPKEIFAIKDQRKKLENLYEKFTKIKKMML